MPPDANHADLAELGLLYEQAVGVIATALGEWFHAPAKPCDEMARAILARLASAEPPILLSRERDMRVRHDDGRYGTVVLQKGSGCLVVFDGGVSEWVEGAQLTLA